MWTAICALREYGHEGFLISLYVAIAVDLLCLVVFYYMDHFYRPILAWRSRSPVRMTKLGIRSRGGV